MRFLKFLILFFILFIVLGGVFVIWFQKKATTIIDQRSVPVTSNTQQTGTSKIGIIPTNVPNPPPGILSLVASSTTLKVGQKISIAVILKADGKSVIGSDVILKYDPKLLRADEINTNSTSFDIYPRKTMDNVKGLVSITAFRPVDMTSLNGSKGMDIAGVYFTALKAGTADISIDFVPFTTNHSTIVESGTSKNILGTVVPVTLTIGK